MSLTSPSSLDRVRRKGRKAILHDWADAEAEHAAERIVVNDPAPFLTDTVSLLRDYLALTEERLYWLMTASNGTWTCSYETFTTRLGRFAQAGLIALAPRLASIELEQSGYTTLRPGNSRFSRIWALGKVGRGVTRRLWGLPFFPEGNETHVAHHALAAEVQFRIAEAAWEFKYKDYLPEGPRKCVVMDAEKKYSVLAPDGMLREKLPAGAEKDRVPAVWAIEYHNEDRTGRAKEKVEAYLRLMNKTDLWQYAWGLEQFPKVLVAYRHEEVLRDWIRQVKALAGPRRDMFALVSLADVMAGGEQLLKLKGA